MGVSFKTATVDTVYSAVCMYDVACQRKDGARPGMKCCCFFN